MLRWMEVGARCWSTILLFILFAVGLQLSQFFNTSSNKKCIIWPLNVVTVRWVVMRMVGASSCLYIKYPVSTWSLCTIWEFWGDLLKLWRYWILWSEDVMFSTTSLHLTESTESGFFKYELELWRLSIIHCVFCSRCGVDNRNITLKLHSYICNRVDTILGLDITSIYIYNVFTFDLWCQLLLSVSLQLFIYISKWYQ